MENIAQIIIVRRDLGMPAGKIIAQACHASMAVLLNMMKTSTSDDGATVTRSIMLDAADPINQWLSGSFTKIAVWAQDEQHLLDLIHKAEESGLPVSKIVDSGRTVFNGVATLTCACVGPASKSQREAITGGLQMIGNVKKGTQE